MPDHDCPAHGRSAFEHQPLDYNGNSIRLLRILPGLSYDGLIQCELWHDTVGHKHDTVGHKHECLSYKWILAGKQKEILINGKSFKVNEHLWSFLKVHGPEYATSRRALWIDLICIQQECPSELNHQVNLMKGLYSSAHQVVAWLGFSERIERAFAFLRELNTLQPRTYHETNKIWHDHIQNKNAELGKDWRELAEHSYWTRAWITQEILCARKLKLLINDSEVEVGPVPGISRLLPQHGAPSDSSRVYPSVYTFLTYLEALCESRKIVGLSLVELFSLLPGRESSKPRDRVYSLSSIASDGASIPIEYNSSDEDVLFQLLEVFKDSACPCLIAYLAQALEVQDSRRLLDVSERMPLVRIAVKKALLMPTMGYELDSQLDYCSQCGASVVDMRLGTMFCTHGLTHCLRDTHLYLQEYRTDDNEKKYKIKPEHSETWVELFSVEDIDFFTTCIESGQSLGNGSRFYLTAGVVVRLLISISESYQPGQVIRLCEHTMNSNGSAVLCNTTGAETESNPEPCCSNKECTKRLYTSIREGLPEAYGRPCISHQYIQQEVQHGAWASPFIIKTFLENSGPWVPWAIKDPSSYRVRNDMQIKRRKRKRHPVSHSSIRSWRQSSYSPSVHGSDHSHPSSRFSPSFSQITGSA